MAATTAINSASYKEWDVERYQDQHSFVWEYGRGLIDWLKPSQGERILDVGCGTGELAAQIADEYDTVSVVGMDRDPAMIAQAKQQFPHVSFVQGDVRTLDCFADDDPLFDAIFSNAALHWVPSADAKQSVQAMSRVLKPGGRFVVELGGKGNIQTILSSMQQVFGSDTNPWYFPSISEYTTLLEQHGDMEVLSATLIDRPNPLVGPDGVANWVRMFGSSFLHDVEEEDMEEALEQIQETCRAKLYDAEAKQWVADYRRLRIVAQKKG
ncbi:Uncharacterized methyltransferase C70.08c [Seminavis robusta]|uniref:Uncharacterized methyltransferase C70.08c n=1 Tax=Seminavis robusta TaxID=568900 RepID=A0A9N8D4V9_9STRA|nr:Uncharacterized methyltransferase C70.08c [Seminavis robusta]|eukprot:Sro5_g004070.1 Uncharacterized methyltransferase C70.08c (268) ;mRNA; f:41583-42386